MSEETKYRFINWKRYQARSDKRMPWVKLWRDLPNSAVWINLTNAERSVFVVTLTLSDPNGVLPCPKVVRKVSGNRPETVRRALHKMKEFGTIETILSDIQDKRREEKTRQEKTREETPKKTPCIKELWNKHSHRTQPKCSSLTTKRISKWNQRWVEKPDVGYWKDVITKIANTPFLQGSDKDPKKWRANIDWLLRPDTHVAVLEGKYGEPVKQLRPITAEDFQ